MQRSDVDRIAEVIAVELARQAGDEVAFQPRIFDGITREGTAETVYLRQAGELVAVLKSHGFGHVPTALHQAADGLTGWAAADWLRKCAAAVTEGAGE